MGNTQTSEVKTKTGKSPGKVKTLIKIRGKRGGKIEEVPFLGVVLDDEREKQKIILDLGRIDTTVPEEQAQKEAIKVTSNSGESSSDSIFTDPLTPVGVSTEINECYHSDENTDGLVRSTIKDNILELPLNNFKLNEFKIRKEEQLNKKISKLGLSKTSQISLECDPRDCFVSENIECVQDDKSNSSSHLEEHQQYSVQSFGLCEYKRHTSEPATSPEVKEGSLVLKRVVSLTLDKEALENKITKPKFVPEKLDFKLYEKFEGYMLINWYLSEFSENHQLRKLVQNQDLKFLATQFCTHLLAAGVLHQIPDKDVPMFNIFKPDLMYYWAHSETPASVPQTPGRLNSISWPPTSPSPSDVFTPVSTTRTEVVMSLKNSLVEHEESLTKDMEILALQEEINRYKQDIERYKTLLEIQNLTTNAIKDFESPERSKSFICDKCGSISSKYAKKNAQLHNAEAQRGEQCIEKSLSNRSLNSIKLQEEYSLTETPTPQLPTDSPIKCYTDYTSSLIFQNDKTPPPEHSCRLSVESVINKSFTEIKDTTPPQLYSSPLSPLNGTESLFTTPVASLLSTVSETSKTLIMPQKTLFPLSPSLTADGIPLPPPLPGEIPSASSLSFASESPVHSKIPPPPPLLLSVVPPSQLSLPNDVFISSASSQLPLYTKVPVLPPLIDAILPPRSPLSKPPDPPSLIGGIPPPPPLLPLGGISHPSPLLCGIPPPPPPPGGIPPPPPPPGGIPPPPPVGIQPPPPPPLGGIPPPPPPPGEIPPPPPPPGEIPPPPPPPGGIPLPPPLGGIPHPLPLTGGIPPPPPPLGGIPLPLPTPPIGGWTCVKSMFNKETVTPKMPMKPLYWTRIVVPTIPHVESSKPIWSEVEELTLENLSEFGNLFSRQVIPKTTPKKKVETGTKLKPVKILDSKRSQNVGILEQSLHVDFTEIENAIYTFDTSVVSLEALQQIYEVRPTSEELQQIRQHLEDKPEIPLDKPEQFLYDLSEISNFPERISCFMFQIEFEDSITNIENTLGNIKSTCTFLTDNRSLIKVLSIILTLGNYMNGGNINRGQADGYGLEILSKLKDVKSNNAQVTLLHFVVRTYIDELDYIALTEMAVPVPNPEDIRKASPVNFDEVYASLRVLDNNLTTCENRIKCVLETATVDNIEPFQGKMKSFVNNARDQLKSEFEHLESCKTKFVSTIKKYQFKSKAEIVEATPPSDFFDLWYLFCKDFNDIWKKELIRREKEKKHELERKKEERKSEVTRVKVKRNGLKEKVKKFVQHETN